MLLPSAAPAYQHVLRKAADLMETGGLTPQALVDLSPEEREASPLIDNAYLHYVFDLWAECWQRREATGDMIVLHYADDTVVGFEHEADARRF